MRRLQQAKHPKGQEVKVGMLITKRALLSASTLLRELHARNMFFYKLKQRQILTRDGFNCRKVWTK